MRSERTEGVAQGIRFGMRIRVHLSVASLLRAGEVEDDRACPLGMAIGHPYRERDGRMAGWTWNGLN